MSVQAMGITASVGVGLATAAGSLGMFWFREQSEKLVATVLGLASGVMLAASVISLLLPALGQAGSGQGLEIAAGFALGAGVLFLADRFFPQESLLAEQKRAWFLVAAMALHNFPEGLAVGVAYSGADPATGMAITGGVAFQNLPEGLLTGLALITAHYRRLSAVALVALTGAVEVLGGFLGLYAVSVFEGLVPVTLAFSAGAMLYVVFAELAPQGLQSARRGHFLGAAGAGLLVTTLMDLWLG